MDPNANIAAAAADANVTNNTGTQPPLTGNVVDNDGNNTSGNDGNSIPAAQLPLTGAGGSSQHRTLEGSSASTMLGPEGSKLQIPILTLVHTRCQLSISIIRLIQEESYQTVLLLHEKWLQCLQKVRIQQNRQIYLMVSMRHQQMKIVMTSSTCFQTALILSTERKHRTPSKLTNRLYIAIGPEVLSAL
ncbi:hypothetical protein PVAP13_7NG105000 [Panicum virgatum]|uniref:Uncharacterized protein n=1 Tax=Panicum virgatum TaxID=38727 RepID=A0A8T0Q457_PANVG|nr:hypothetical protein PVAP13_7NG105000 [Panicum virgatum]